VPFLTSVLPPSWGKNDIRPTNYLFLQRKQFEYLKMLNSMLISDPMKQLQQNLQGKVVFKNVMDK